jgi:hypothetical protein
LFFGRHQHEKKNHKIGVRMTNNVLFKKQIAFFFYFEKYFGNEG